MEEEAVEEEDMEAETTGVVEGSEVGEVTVATGLTRRVLRLVVQSPDRVKQPTFLYSFQCIYISVWC